jgi:hypothetical protein
MFFVFRFLMLFGYCVLMFLVQLNLFCWLIESIVLLLVFVAIFNYIYVILNYFYLLSSFSFDHSYSYNTFLHPRASTWFGAVL